MAVKKIHRIGERNTNKQGLVMEITEYYNNRNIVVTFIDTGEEVKCRYSQFKSGTIRATILPSSGRIVLTAVSLIAGIVAILSLIIIGLKI